MAAPRLTEYVTFRVTKKMAVELQDVADEEEKDISDIMRRMLARGLATRRARKEALLRGETLAPESDND